MLSCLRPAHGGQAQWECKASGVGPRNAQGCQGDGREWWSQARKAPSPDAQTSCCCPCANSGLLLGAPLTLYRILESCSEGCSVLRYGVSVPAQHRAKPATSSCHCWEIRGGSLGPGAGGETETQRGRVGVIRLDWETPRHCLSELGTPIPQARPQDKQQVCGCGGTGPSSHVPLQ